MKRTIALLLTGILCLSLAACGKEPEHLPGTQESTIAQTGEETVRQSIELAGPWHLDSEKNDLAAFLDSPDLFPGYGEWGAGMEIRSDGQMSWYIGAEGWHGTYTAEGTVIHAQLTSDLEQTTQPWDFRITAQNGGAELEMDYQDMTIYWVYGDQGDTANGTDNT